MMGFLKAYNSSLRGGEGRQSNTEGLDIGLPRSRWSLAMTGLFVSLRSLTNKSSFRSLLNKSSLHLLLNKSSICFVCFLPMLLLCLTLTTPAYATPDVTTNLVGWWKLDETSGTTVADSSGNGNSGTMTNMTADAYTRDGALGKALDLTTGTRYITIANESNFDFSTSFSVSAWVNFTIAYQYSTVLQKGGAWSIEASNSNSLAFKVEGLTNGGVGNSGQNINDGKWHLVVGTWDSSTNQLRLYVDGENAGWTNGGADNTPNLTNDPLVLGKNTIAGRQWNGSIDDVRVYNRRLSDEDIKYLYESRDGNIKYDQDARVPKYYGDYQWKAMGPSPYVPNAVEFDGINDYLMDNNVDYGTSGKKIHSKRLVEKGCCSAKFTYFYYG